MDYNYTPATTWYPTAEKDPASARNFGLNWAKELNGDVIDTSEWITDGLINVADSNTDSTTTILLSGGSEGSTYQVQNTITTDAGQTFRKSLVVAVREL